MVESRYFLDQGNAIASLKAKVKRLEEENAKLKKELWVLKKDLPFNGK